MLATYREIEQRGRIQSALQRKQQPGSQDDNARLAEYWRKKAARTRDAGDVERAERFAELAKRK